MLKPQVRFRRVALFPRNVGRGTWEFRCDQSRSKMVTDRADGFALTLGPLLFNLRARIGASAPAGNMVGEEVPYGFMMSYGQDFPDFFRRAVTYTDKILKGDQIQTGIKRQQMRSASVFHMAACCWDSTEDASGWRSRPRFRRF
jgi:hypothetical protein